MLSWFSLLCFFRSKSENSHHKKSNCSSIVRWQSCFGTWCLSLLAATINEASELINALVLQVCLRLNSAQLKSTLTQSKTLQSRCHFRANCLRNTLIGQAKNPLLLGKLCNVYKPGKHLLRNLQMSNVIGFFMTTWWTEKGTPLMPNKNVRIQISHFPWTQSPAPEVAHLVDPMQCSPGSWHLSGNLLRCRGLVHQKKYMYVNNIQYYI